MVLTNGRVGIGETTPQAPLDIFNNSAPGGQFISLRRSGAGVVGISFQQNGVTATGIISPGDSIRGLAFIDNFAGGGGTERMRLTPAGNLGIGTTAPGTKLDILGVEGADVSAGGLISISGGTGAGGSPVLKFGTNTTTGYSWIQSHGSLPLRINELGNNTILNAAAGNVGIGTTNLYARLQSSGATATYSPTLGSPTGGALLLTNNNPLYGTLFGIGANGNGWIQQQRVDGTATSYNLLLQPAGGNVGIGTSSPSQALEVNGNVKIGNNGTLPNLVIDSTSSGDDWTAQGAYISLGESGALGSAALHLTYRGDGYGFIGAGAPATAVPAGGYMRFAYSTRDIFTASNLEIYDGKDLVLRSGSTDPGDLIYRNSSGSEYGRLWAMPDGVRSRAGGTNGVYLANGATAWASNSDLRLKNILSGFNNAIEDLMTLNPIHFTWKNDPTNTPQVGLIAQEVQQILPEAVSIDNEGFLSVRYTDLIPLLTAGFQELNTKVTSLSGNLAITATGEVYTTGNVSPEVLASLGYSDSKNEIEAATYSVLDSTGSVVTALADFSQIAVGKVKAGLISATNIVVKNLVAESTKTKELKTAVISPLSDLSDTIILNGDASVSGTLTATKIGTSEARIGTLFVDQIIGREGNFSTLMTDKISSLREEIRSLIATETATTSGITGSTLLAESETWENYLSFEASDSAVLSGNLTLTDSMVIGAQLTVLGQTQLGNAFITGTFAAGEIAIRDNFIETTNTALYLQPSGLGSVHIMGDTLVIAENGDVRINGNLAVSGKITASEASVSGSLIANMITANDISAKNITTETLNIATDSATTIIAQSGFGSLATSSASLTSNATAGSVTLPAGKTEVIIYNNLIKSTSMVYLTPAGSTQNQVPYLKEKFISPTPTPESTSSATPNSYFTIAIDNSLPQDTTINWWIIN